MKRKKIVIVGCGFAGITLAKYLRKTDYEVLLLDKNNYHTFQPLLYQVATNGLEPDSIAYPVRKLIRNRNNIRFQMSEVLSIDTDKKTIQTSENDIVYDYLILATGSTNNFFSLEDKKSLLFPLKSIVDALDLRSFITQNLEKATLTTDEGKRQELINISIVGGGPTGIELAGALAEMKKFVLPKDFPEIDFGAMTIHLFEAGGKLLASMSEKASSASQEYLEKLGVHLHLNTVVEDVQKDKIVTKAGDSFHTDTVIWTAGVKGTAIKGLPGKVVSSGERVLVDAFNKVIDLENVFAVGDVCAHATEENPKGLPMLAPVAMQQAENLAKNLVKSLKGKEMLPFDYTNKGSMATIGRNKAVVDFPKRSIKGRFAWFVWMFVHVISLVGFRNKLITFIDWTYNYFSYDRPLGLIIRPFNKNKKTE